MIPVTFIIDPFMVWSGTKACIQHISEHMMALDCWGE